MVHQRLCIGSVLEQISRRRHEEAAESDFVARCRLEQECKTHSVVNNTRLNPWICLLTVKFDRARPLVCYIGGASRNAGAVLDSVTAHRDSSHFKRTMVIKTARLFLVIYTVMNLVIY